MSTKNLLVELFVEELPPKALNKLGEAFANQLRHALQASGLASDASVLTAYASPRRLAAHLTHVASKAADRAQSLKLMPVAVGLDASGAPTPALLKRLQSIGLDASAVSQLTQQTDGKAPTLYIERTLAGGTVTSGVAGGR